MRKLPALHSLRAFEATARLKGVHKAAQELCVTHGAVSRQLKQLEVWLGVTLFDRSGRTISLNNQGLIYLKSISAALDLVEQASHNMQQTAPSNALGISTTHSIASKWLVDKLKLFSQHSDTEVWLDLEQHCVDFSQSSVDIAVRMGTGPWPDLHCIPLLSDKLIAVASPSLIATPLNSITDLANFKLLHDQDPSSQWLRLFNENQLPLIDLSKGTRFSSSDILLSSAVDGQGVALVSKRLASSDLAQGKLIQVAMQTVNLGNYFWLVMPREAYLKPRVREFCNWLQQAA
ncbi:MAG: LysR substrate-binding domain-containing protein [Oceanospirillaceae bacterium]